MTLPDHIVIQPDPGLLVQGFFAARRYTNIGVLLDEHTLEHCYPFVQTQIPPHQTFLVPAGEEHKNLDTCVLVWQKLTSSAFDRHSLLLVLGGGVLGDLGGFCASTYKRGIDFLLVPTTLLAQADASVGGKLGIDFQHYKNHIGLFREPAATLIASDFLKTLPVRELRSGFAEVIKHCIISDKLMWDKVRSRPLADQPWGELIRHSVAFKSGVTAQDPKEGGLRKILNFGHTIGHALESHFLAEGNRIFHGEAIAVGMISEAFIARRKGLLQQAELDQISQYLHSIFGIVALPDHRQIMESIIQDKKNKGGQILMALPEGIGKAVWDEAVTEEEIRASLDYYSARQT